MLIIIKTIFSEAAVALCIYEYELLERFGTEP